MAGLRIKKDTNLLKKNADISGDGYAYILGMTNWSRSGKGKTALTFQGRPLFHLFRPLRSNNIDDVLVTFEQLNMTPLSIQPVKNHNFTLYFYAFTSERPPSKNLFAVENRTWLYQRPYTVLEIQYLPDATDIRKSEYGCAGYERIEISGLPNTVQNDDLLNLGVVHKLKTLANEFR